MVKINLAVFASGTGTNFQNLYHTFKDDKNTNLELLISNNSGSGAIEFAKENGIRFKHISSKTHSDPDEAILDELMKSEIDLIALAGYMKKLSPKLIQTFENRILNIHPSLLPKFGGKGMFGMNVHRAVIESAEKQSGATVHLVNEEYDKGKIIIQKSVKIDRDETPESLQKKVAKIEYEIYPLAIKEYISQLVNYINKLF